MIQFRPINLDSDYPVLLEWWKGHRALPVPKVILPDGWIASAAGVDIAASFLYFHRGKIGVIEWTTTNPRCAFSRDLVAAVKGLFTQLEDVAREAGCIAVISFVKPNGSEERIVRKSGYATSADDVGHRLYAKPLNAPAFAQPDMPVLSCPTSQ